MTTSTITYGPSGTIPSATTTSSTGTTSSTTSTSSTSTSSSSSTSSTGMSSDENMFLQLLVAQMQNQDPNNATDPTTFLTQTAEFTTVEKLDSLNTLTQSVYNASQQQTATSMVGQTVTYTDASGDTQTGKVTGVSVGSSTPNLTINGLSVSLSSVTAVGDAPPTASTTSGSSGSGTSSDSSGDTTSS